MSENCQTRHAKSTLDMRAFHFVHPASCSLIYYEHFDVFYVGFDEEKSMSNSVLLQTDRNMHGGWTM